jgi:hypothetical protein
MKKTYSTLIILTIYIFAWQNANAQLYESVFGNDSTVWVIEESNTSEINSSGTITSTQYTYRYVKDTLLNNLKYKIYTGTSIKDLQHTHYIRETSDHSKVYCWEPSKELEYLNMDISLNIKDTFNLREGGVTPFIVDSVYTINGRKHIRFNTSAYTHTNILNPSFEFIEGVGCNRGLFYQGNNNQDVCWGRLLISFYKDGTISTNSSKYKASTAISNENAQETQQYPSKIKIQPNPVVNFSLVEVNGYAVKKLELIDSKGSLIQAYPPTNKHQFKIDARKIPEGVYIVSITTEDSKTLTEKICVKK